MEIKGMWLVSGCGVSALCSTKQGILYWTGQIISKGGWPAITLWSKQENNVS